MSSGVLPSSFRDPSGFVFVEDGELYRQVNESYRAQYDHLMSSGLYDRLVRDGLLVAHTEVGAEHARRDGAYKVIRPERVPFVSYPYEWSFSQLQDAALATLAVQRRAFEHGMTLKDGSAYNVQFMGGKPLFIDTLSFDLYRPGQIWVPYRQFCQHFLAPLALMATRDARLHRMLRPYLDGIPLDLAARLLPARTRLSFGLLTHLHLHARSQVRHAGRPVKPGRGIGPVAFQGLIDSLETTVRKLHWKPEGTEWADYYSVTNYSDESSKKKQAIVGAFVARVRPATVWDLGANTGLYSRIAAAHGATVVAFDVDVAAVERNYLECKKNGDERLLPLVLDLTNPSPGIGWDNRERMTAAERGPADLAMALALVHHLAIGNNVPLGSIAAHFASLCRWLVIEFVDKQDSQVRRLLATREDIFTEYTREGFEAAFAPYFDLRAVERPGDALRWIYLMECKS
jgi:hypothetical protein